MRVLVAFKINTLVELVIFEIINPFYAVILLGVGEISCICRIGICRSRVVRHAFVVLKQSYKYFQISSFLICFSCLFLENQMNKMLNLGLKVELV